MSCIDKTLKIYLAGKMSGLTMEQMNDWRISITNRLNIVAENAGYKVIVINPVLFYNFEGKRHQSEDEVENFDLYHATTSDLVIVNLDGLNTSDGSKLEVHDCNYHNGIPVIAFGESGLYEDLHPWIKNDITRVEENAQDVVNYIRDFYMI